MSSIDFLQWDTDFFGFKIGLIQNNFEQAITEAKQNNYKLLYCKVDPLDKISNENLLKCNAILADVKVTYILSNLNVNSVLSANVIAFDDNIPTKEMYELAIQSGEYSRFKTDINFNNNAFQKLYRVWIENSVSKKNAQKVLINTIDDKVVGLVTLGEKSNIADIGIIAVDFKQRGKNIGTHLINATIRESKLMGYSKLQVVTQKANESACNFYEKNDFVIYKIENIYHLWLQ